MAGISVVSFNQAEFAFNNVWITTESMSYEAVLSNSDGDSFYLVVENLEYTKKNLLVEGRNEGYFEGLTKGTSYRLYVIENSQSGKIIYDTSFETQSFEDPYMNGLVWDGTADYLHNTIEVSVDYFDPQDEYSDFTLTLSTIPSRAESQEPVIRSYLLEKTSNSQVLSGNSDDNETPYINFRTDKFTYAFTYSYKGETFNAGEGEIAFTDNSNSVEEVRELIWDKSANFLDRTFKVQLDYQDDLSIISNFELTLESVDGEVSQTFPLSKTLEEQTISTSENGDYLIDVRHGTYTYRLTYVMDGQTKVAEEGEITFTDNSGAVAVGPTINWNYNDENKVLANFNTGEFDISLSYDDPFEEFSETATLKLTQGAISAEFEIELSKKNQTIHTFSTDIDITSGESITYELSYSNYGVLDVSDSGTIEFVHNGSDKVMAVSIGDADFINRTFDVTLEFNPENITESYSELKLLVSDSPLRADGSTGQGQSVTFDLDFTTDKQTISTSSNGEFAIDIRSGNLFYYSLTYNYENKNIETDSGSITFTDPNNPQSVMNDFVINNVADLASGTFSVSVDYQDDYRVISDFSLTLTNSETAHETETATYSLALSTEEQELSIANTSISSLYGYSFNYSFSYTVDGVAQAPLTGQITFTDKQGRTSIFNNFSIDEENADLINRTFPINIDYQDDYGFYSDFSLSLSRNEEGATAAPEKVELSIEQKAGTQVVDVSEIEMFDIRDGEPFNYVFSYHDSWSGQDMEYTGTVTFTDPNNPQSIVNGLEIDTAADIAEGTFNVTLDYQDDYEIISDFKLTMTVTDTRESHTFELNKTLESQELDVTDTPINRWWGATFECELSYTIDGYEDSKTLDNTSFTDKNGRQSTFNQVALDAEANFLENTFKLTLDYKDDFSYYTNFALTLVNEDSDIEYTFNNIEKTTEEQTIDCTDTPISLREVNNFQYEFSYEDRGTTYTFNGDIEFSDSTFSSSEYYSSAISNTADFINQTFEVTLYFKDDFNDFSDFKIELSEPVEDGSEEMNTVVIPLEKEHETQTISVANLGGDVYFDIVTREVTWTISYYDSHQDATITADSGTVDFQNSRVSTFDGFDCDFSYVSVNDDKLLAIRLNYDDDAQEFESVRLTFTLQGEDSVVTGDDWPNYVDIYYVDLTNQWQFVTLMYNDETQANAFEMVLSGELCTVTATIEGVDSKTGENTSLQLEKTDKTLIDASDNEEVKEKVYGVYIRDNQIYEERITPITISLIYIDINYIYSDFVVKIVTNGHTYEYPLDANENTPDSNFNHYFDVTYLYLDSNENYQDMLDDLKDHPADIYLEYTYLDDNTSVTEEVLSYQGFNFVIV